VSHFPISTDTNPVKRRGARPGAAKKPDFWFPALLLKSHKDADDAAAFELIERLPTRGYALMQRVRDLVPVVRNGDPGAREQLIIYLQILDRPKPKKQQGQRKPSLSAALKQADTAGKAVRNATVAPDGTVSIAFDEPEPTESNNPWLADLEKVTKQ
jgi:hypothetical protein